MNTFSIKNQLSSPWFLSMALSSFMAVGILAIRIYVTHQMSYSFLAWNLFLAWIPFVLSASATALRGTQRSSIVILLAAWLLFFPNAPYILTDLFHLHPRPGVPLWYDLILILSFAWTGLLLGYASLLQVQGILESYLGKKWTWVPIGGFLFLTSFGVYLGRYLRWNSWDALTRPMDLFVDIFDRVIRPMAHLKSTGFTLCFGLFLVVTYATFVAWARFEKRF